MPPKVSTNKPRTRRNPLGKVDANAVKKPTAKSSTQSPKDPKGTASKASPKTHSKPSTSTPTKATTKSSPKAKTAKLSTKNAPRTASLEPQSPPAETIGKPTKSAGRASSKPQGKAESAKSNMKKYQDSAKYLLLCRLQGTMDPTITRLLSVPSVLRFDQLHEVMQIAFGWANCHMHRFDVNELPEGDDGDDGDSEEGDDSVWKPTKLLLSLTAHPDLDRDMMGDPERFKGTNEVTLADVFEDEKYTNATTEVVYEYDMGDGWVHDIVFLGREAPGVRRIMSIPSDCPVICLNGEGHPCAEDAGGIDGWEDLKEQFARPRRRDDDGMRDWYKNGGCVNGDPKGLDPYRWDIFQVNFELAELVAGKPVL